MSQAITIGERLRWLRESRHLTLRQFADRVGCHAGYLSKLESGKADNPSDRFLMSIVVTFRVDLQWLRSGIGEPYSRWAGDKATQESLSDWAPERVARVMAVLDDLQSALVPEQVLRPLLANRSLEEVQAFWHETISSDLPVTARLFWNDAFRDLQFQIMDQVSCRTFPLTHASTGAILPPVKSQLDSLLAGLDRLIKEPRKKTELADYLGAPLASVSRWLSGKREPGREITLKMLRWVEDQERQQNTPGSASNTAKGKTQVHKSTTNEKANSNPPKR